MIVKQHKAQTPIYRHHVAYGYFCNLVYTWEKPKELVL
jgi:S-adenosylmethionine synthetase